MRQSRLPMMLVIAVLLAATALADERILDYHSDIRVQPDSSLIVHEVIRVRSEGRRIRHGIFRDFPTRYDSLLGEHYSVNFQVLDVRRDGAPEHYSQQASANGIRVKMGDASTLLTSGEHIYELTYTVTRELGFFPDHDELYWNVTGNAWTFPIDRASAIVSLPGAGQAGALKVAGYTGPQGSQEHNLDFDVVDASTIRFQTTTPLGRNEGLTIAVGFPKGLVAEPSAADRMRWFLEDHAAAAMSLLGLALVLIYYFAAWIAVGRDPWSGIITVTYEPPPGLSPPAMCFLQHMGYDDRVFVSAVVDLAVKGFVTIEQDASLYSLKRLKPPAGSLPVEESNLMRILFSSSGEITISAADAARIITAGVMLTNDLNLEENKVWFRKNTRWAVPGILLSLATLASVALSVSGSMAGGSGFLMVWLLSAWSVVTGGLIAGAIRSFRSKKSVAIGALAFIPAAIVALIELVVLGIFAHVAGVLPPLTILALLVTNVAGILLLRALTPEGRKVLDQIEGFKLFLTEVESDRLQRMNPPEKTPALFERCFPYALALGVEQAWTKQFVGVLAQAAVATGGAAAPYSPAWFSGTDWNGFDVGGFAGSFSGSFSSAISSASSPPGSSSGSGGGGSSGGGGGGGGGGGW